MSMVTAKRGAAAILRIEAQVLAAFVARRGCSLMLRLHFAPHVPLQSGCAAETYNKGSQHTRTTKDREGAR